MGLFTYIREDVLNEFESYGGAKINSILYDKNGNLNGFSLFKRGYGLATNNRLTSDLFSLLEKQRWGEVYEPTCPRCSSKSSQRGDNKNYKCDSHKCQAIFNALYGTILHGTKVSINIWYDLATEYRKNNKVNTTAFATKHKVQQRTAWYMLAKIKTSDIINEPDIPVLKVLLSPLPFTIKKYKSKRQSKTNKT